MKIFFRKYRGYLGALLVAACFIFNNGCALIFATHKTTIITAQDSTSLDIASGYSSIGINNIGDNNITALVPGRLKTIPVSNKINSYSITQTRNGYLPYTMPIARYKFNPGKGIDLCLHVIGAGILLSVLSNSSSNSNSNNSASEAPLFPPAVTTASVYFGGWGWLDLFIGPWKLYPKVNKMPALVKIPYRSNDENKLYVKSVGVDIKKNNLKETYYKSFSAYNNHAATITRSEENAIKHRNTQFADTLNHILSTWNYQDTNRGFFSHVYNGAYYLKCEVNDFSIVGVDRYMFVDFKCNWKIYGTTSDNEIYSYTTDCSSSWLGYSEGDFEFDEFATDVFQRSMAEFLNTDEVQKCLHDKNATESVIKKWAPINITETAKDSVKNLDEAITAVVTVVVSEGHGSGCIISPDGYVITNHHVTTEDTSAKVKILFSNGDSTTATVLRSNAEYDLAILKLDKPGPYKYFPVDTVTHEIPIGDDVFAIGTPESIFLGQTLTKGIISGERSAGNKTIIQTDVSINPGNSGGALVSPSGHLLGIVNAKMKGEGIQGIGFAIPASYIDDALKVQFSK
jgi:serine protease Do